VELDEDREKTEAENLKVQMAKDAKILGKRQNIAATCIQREMRGFVKRKLEFEAMNPKKGKKDKKGKKKK